MAEIRATTKLDSKGFEVGTKKMKSSLEKLTSKLKGMSGMLAGAFGVGALTGAVKETIAFGSELTDLAAQAGITTDQLQALEIAAINAGVAPAKIRTAFSKLNVVMGQARRGMKTYIDLFEEVGITQEDVARMSPVEVFEELARVLSVAENGSASFGAALEILGTRSGAQLIEVFKKINNDGLDQMIKKGKAAGQIMSEDLVNSLDQTADALEQLKRNAKVLTGKAVGGLSGFFKDVATFFAAQKKGIMSIELIQQKNDVKNEQRRKEEAKKEAQRIAEEKRRQAEKDEAMKKQVEKSFDEAVKLADQQEAEEEKKAKAKLKKEEALAKKIADAKKRFAGLEVSATGVEADRLARIGGSFGGAVSPELQIARQQLDLDKKRNDFLSNLAPEIRRALEESGGLL